MMFWANTFMSINTRLKYINTCSFLLVSTLNPGNQKNESLTSCKLQLIFYRNSVLILAFIVTIVTIWIFWAKFSLCTLIDIHAIGTRLLKSNGTSIRNTIYPITRILSITLACKSWETVCTSSLCVTIV